MSQALAHFAFGSAMTVLGVAYLLPTVRYPRVVGLLGGVWAMVPDGYWISPVFGPELAGVHDSMLAELFWAHRTLDLADPTDSNVVAAGMVALLLVSTLLAERRGYRSFPARDESVETDDHARVNE